MSETHSRETKTIQLLQSALDGSLDYRGYRAEMAVQAERGKTSGPEQSQALVGYTFLNHQRMRRWEKTYRLPEAVVDRLQQTRAKHTWLVLTESWCGDAAPILPVLNAFAEASADLDLRIADRDRNPELMERYPTDGALAIPKLLVLDGAATRVLGHWGPRPSEPMEMVRAFKKAHGRLSAEFRESLQRWYNRDKGRAITEELLGLLALE
jgi:hypothetical protein